MPRIQKVGRSEKFVALVSEAVANNEKNDCAVKALAIAAGVSYEVAHATCAAFGRKERHGIRTSNVVPALESLGKKAVRVTQRSFIERYPASHQVLRSVTTHHPDRFHDVWADGKTYLVFTRGHVLAVVNGVNHDHTRGTARRATEIFEVV